MRLHSAYLNRKAAQKVNSVFEAEMYVKKIYKDGVDLWELVKKEEDDDQNQEKAEEKSEITAIIKDEIKEIGDITDLVNQTFKVLRHSMLIIHTQLDQLKQLKKDDEVLEQSGFPIEVADQLEEMLSKEIQSIIKHLRDMQSDMTNEENNNSEAQANQNSFHD